MNIEEVDTTKNEFTEEELDAMIMILEKSEEIKADGPLFSIVKKRMQGKVKSIKSLEDLKSVANEKMLTED